MAQVKGRGSANQVKISCDSDNQNPDEKDARKVAGEGEAGVDMGLFHEPNRNEYILYLIHSQCLPVTKLINNLSRYLFVYLPKKFAYPNRSIGPKEGL